MPMRRCKWQLFVCLRLTSTVGGWTDVRVQQLLRLADHHHDKVGLFDERGTYNPSQIMDDNNEWAVLAPPLNDIFLSVIIPCYLTIGDLASLSSVSQRYHKVFRLTESTNASLFADILKRDAAHFANGRFKYMDQLPTFGSCITPEEALVEDPSLVASLRSPALRRRRLVLLNTSNTSAQEAGRYTTNRNDAGEHNENDEDDHHLAVISEFRSKRFLRFTRSRDQANHLGKARFLCLNETERNIFCHWINFDGNMIVRNGDCIPPWQTERNNGSRRQGGTCKDDESKSNRRSSIVVTPSIDFPNHVFSHQSYVNHSFALCLEEGGPPFAIYQIRRCHFTRVRLLAGVGPEGLEHCHAIAIVPTKAPGNAAQCPVSIEELHCNMVRSTSIYEFKFFDRQTGAQIPFAETTTTVQGNPTVQDTTQQPNRAPETVFDPKNLAKLYYGSHIPGMDDPVWQLHVPDVANYLVMKSEGSGDDDSPTRNFYRNRIECPCKGPLYFPAAAGQDSWDNGSDDDDSGDDVV